MEIPITNPILDFWQPQLMISSFHAFLNSKKFWRNTSLITSSTLIRMFRLWTQWTSTPMGQRWFQFLMIRLVWILRSFRTIISGIISLHKILSSGWLQIIFTAAIYPSVPTISRILMVFFISTRLLSSTSLLTRPLPITLLLKVESST